MQYLEKAREMYMASPIVVKETAMTIARFAILALVLLFVVLILDISKNMVLRGGKHLLKQGGTAVVLMLLLGCIFAPRTLKLPNESVVEKVSVVLYDEKDNKHNFDLTKKEKSELLSLMSQSPATICLSKDADKKAGGHFMVQIILPGENLYLQASEKRTYYFGKTNISFMYAFTSRDNEIYRFLCNAAK